MGKIKIWINSWIWFMKNSYSFNQFNWYNPISMIRCLTRSIPFANDSVKTYRMSKSELRDYYAELDRRI